MVFDAEVVPQVERCHPGVTSVEFAKALKNFEEFKPESSFVV